MYEKVKKIINFIESNIYNSTTVLISDIDIIIYKNIEELMHLDSYDIIFQKENSRNNINTGFILLKCCNKTLLLWKKVLNIMDNYKKNSFINEQKCINDIIKKDNFDIKWKLFPNEIWAFSNLPLPANIYLHHANCTVCTKNKSSLELKIEQIKTIMNKYQHPLNDVLKAILSKNN